MAEKKVPDYAVEFDQIPKYKDAEPETLRPSGTSSPLLPLCPIRFQQYGPARGETEGGGGVSDLLLLK